MCLDYRRSRYSNGTVPIIETQNQYSQTPLVIAAEIYLAGILILIIIDFFSHFWHGDFINHDVYKSAFCKYILCYISHDSSVKGSNMDPEATRFLFSITHMPKVWVIKMNFKYSIKMNFEGA